jgi:hypothetical protein
LLLVSAVAAGVVAVTGCGNRPPGVPVLSGPGVGQPGETLRFRAWSVDPEGSDVAYRFDWGDSGTTDWTPDVPSGDTFERPHVYTAAGEYAVTARSRDRQGLESGPAVPLGLRVAVAGPFPLGAPVGPDTIYAGAAAWFSAVAGHVRGESVSVQFDWAGSTGGWTGPVAAGLPARDSHRFAAVGEFPVRFRARDRDGNVSVWSPPTAAAVRARPLVPPSRLRPTSSGGTTVVVRWDTGENPDSTSYGLWFRPVEMAAFQLVLVVRGGAAWHDPGGTTGWYTAATLAGGRELFAAETVTTVPVYSDTVVLGELNTGELAGYGWDADGRARRYSMTDTASAQHADCYLTDRGPGSTGPALFLSSPHVGPDDPGGVVPAAPWRRSGLVLLADQGQEPLPGYDPLRYHDLADVTLLDAWVAVHTASGCYAVISTISPEPESARVRVRSWYQPVAGLRLLRRAQEGP